MHWTQLALGASLSFSGLSYATDGFFGKLMHPARRAINHSGEMRRYPPARFNDGPGTLGRRQADARCGADNGGARCPNNLCCSQYGWCGDGFDYCAELVGCQPQYGRCGDAPTTTPTPTPTPTPTSSSSTSSSTSSSSSSSSRSSSTTSSSTPPGPTPTGPLIISPNGMCGNTTTCAGSGFGSCCSQFWYCGNSPDYCGTGCNPAFGTCGGGIISSSSSSTSSPTPTPTPSSSTTSSTTSSTSSTTSTSSTSSTTSSIPSPTSSTSTRTPTPTPTPGVPPSTNGQCGNGVGCIGSGFGDCCSEYGWCGTGFDYCRTLVGCQPQWGRCE